MKPEYALKYGVVAVMDDTGKIIWKSAAGIPN